MPVFSGLRLFSKGILTPLFVVVCVGGEPPAAMPANSGVVLVAVAVVSVVVVAEVELGEIDMID